MNTKHFKMPSETFSILFRRFTIREGCIQVWDTSPRIKFIRTVSRIVAKKYHKEIADEIKIALENETEMQQLRLDLERKGYSKSAGTFCISNSAYGITCHSPEGH